MAPSVVAAAPAPSVQAAPAPAAEEVRKPQLALAGPAVSGKATTVAKGELCVEENWL